MYEFNPMTSMELLENLRRETPAAGGEISRADAVRTALAARASSLSELFRRMVQRIAPSTPRDRAA